MSKYLRSPTRSIITSNNNPAWIEIIIKSFTLPQEFRAEDNPVSVKGTDDYGFPVLPAGGWHAWKGFGSEGEGVAFWAIEEPSSYDNGVSFRHDDAGTFFFVAKKYYGLYVRCIKD